MMDRSGQAIRLILKHEGGFVNHPKDPGGATNKGITIATFRRYIKPGGTVADLKNLTEEQAVIVYKRQYWDRVVADLLPAGVDYTVADFAVNSGPSRAARELQKIVGAVADGKVGPNTLAAVEAMSPTEIINKLNDRRLVFMQSLKGGRMWKTFGRGWARRVSEVRAVSLDWATERPADAPSALAHDEIPKAQGGLWAAILGLLRGLVK
jgi:lysozyme family protein